MARVYLDLCSLNRPFDDQTQERIRLEAEAVLRVLALVRAGQAEWLSSDAVEVELAAGPASARRSWITELLGGAVQSVQVGEKEAARAEELTAIGLRPLDALHLACAEAGRADVFLTTDDEVIRVARRPTTQLHVRVMNPMAWVQELPR
ncbi:MAG TPA: PIN domain-containing protein [Chloroflexota bacterium]|nr:PIN domain-containing protein [Chloroflexota bacterium]